MNIYNNNSKNTASDKIYNAFNDFIFSSDIKVLGKLLHRYDFFKKVIDLPGDIVEIGVFKGSGIASFSKFLEIYCPNSNKKVVGFDIFSPENGQTILNKDSSIDKDNMNKVYSRVEENQLTLKSVTDRLDNMQINNKHILVEGDVECTIPEYLKNNPGLRISLLYLDADLDRPTYYSLKYLWDRILPGGVILFDEYQYHTFSESDGADRFLKEIGLEHKMMSTNWLAPSSYLIKP